MYMVGEIASRGTPSGARESWSASALPSHRCCPAGRCRTGGARHRRRSCAQGARLPERQLPLWSCPPLHVVASCGYWGCSVRTGWRLAPVAQVTRLGSSWRKLQLLQLPHQTWLHPACRHQHPLTAPHTGWSTRCPCPYRQGWTLQRVPLACWAALTRQQHQKQHQRRLQTSHSQPLLLERAMHPCPQLLLREPPVPAA